jgi:hypothetical protein
MVIYESAIILNTTFYLIKTILELFSLLDYFSKNVYDKGGNIINSLDKLNPEHRL